MSKVTNTTALARQFHMTTVDVTKRLLDAGLAPESETISPASGRAFRTWDTKQAEKALKQGRTVRGQDSSGTPVITSPGNLALTQRVDNLERQVDELKGLALQILDQLTKPKA